MNVDKKSGLPTGVDLQIDREQVRRISELLRSTPETALVVFERSMRRGNTAGRTQAHKEIRERYDIPLKSLTESHTYYTFDETVKRVNDGVIGHIHFAGSKIPLFRFHPKPSGRLYTNRFVNGHSGWRVTTDVSAADVKGSMRPRPHAFIATMQSGHKGMFKREGNDSLPIQEYFSFSVRDMLNYQPAQENILNRMAEIVSRTMEHELMRTLTR